MDSHNHGKDTKDKHGRPHLWAEADFDFFGLEFVKGVGGDPSVGGMAVSLITLFIVPCLFCAVEEWKWKRNETIEKR
jgi:hypothetical protein